MIRVLNPMEKVSEEKREVIAKVEKVLEEVYSKEVDTEDYVPFMEKYNENLEAKVASDPNFRFEYK